MVQSMKSFYHMSYSIDLGHIELTDENWIFLIIDKSNKLLTFLLGIPHTSMMEQGLVSNLNTCGKLLNHNLHILTFY